MGRKKHCVAAFGLKLLELLGLPERFTTESVSLNFRGHETTHLLLLHVHTYIHMNKMSEHRVINWIENWERKIFCAFTTADGKNTQSEYRASHPDSKVNMMVNKRVSYLVRFGRFLVKCK